MTIILHSGPAQTTRKEESENVEAEYGHFNFNLSDISSADIFNRPQQDSCGPSTRPHPT